MLPPDAITRVSDYVPEIVAYIEAIQANGFCYEAGGSVYFDTAAFIKSGKKCAPRALRPPPPRAAAALPVHRALIPRLVAHPPQVREARPGQARGSRRGGDRRARRGG